jgi:DNA invertase Pin-like site-specific DNA recombinase
MRTDESGRVAPIRKFKRDGRYKGRVPTARRQTGEIVRLKSEGVRPAEIARKLGVDRASAYQVVGEQEKVAA